MCIYIYVCLREKRYIFRTDVRCHYGNFLVRLVYIDSDMEGAGRVVRSLGEELDLDLIYGVGWEIHRGLAG